MTGGGAMSGLKSIADCCLVQSRLGAQCLVLPAGPTVLGPASPQPSLASSTQGLFDAILLGNDRLKPEGLNLSDVFCRCTQ